MRDDNQTAGKGNDLTRREFMRDGATAAAGFAAGLAALADQQAQAAEQIEKTRSYNPDMEYRRLGKTELWVSVVCLGGHWKRVDKMVPGVFKCQLHRCLYQRRNHGLRQSSPRPA